MGQQALATTQPKKGQITPPQVGPSPFPNQQVAPLTPQQMEAMNLVSGETFGTMPAVGSGSSPVAYGGLGPAGMADAPVATSSGSPGTQRFLNNAIGEQNATIGGAFLGKQNPFLADYFNAAAKPMIENYAQATAPNILQQSAAAGDLGSSGTMQAFANAEKGLAEGLGNLSAGIYEPAYAQERGIMQEAAQGAPGLAAGAYIPSQELMQSGQVGQNQAQNVLDTAYQNLYGKAQWPFQALGMLGGALGPAGGQSGTTISTGPGAGSMK